MSVKMTPPPGSAPRPVSRWARVDETVTLLLFMPFGFAALALLQVGALTAMQADACVNDGVSCNDALITVGALVARYGPLGLPVVAIIAAVLRLIRHRIAFWVPLLGLAAVIGVVITSDALVNIAITGR